MRRTAAFCLALLVALPWATRAQSPAASQPSSPSSNAEFLSAYRVRLGAWRLATDDERFAWEGRFSGDVDFVDYGLGRINFFAEYDVVLGSELRAFDANQSIYTLDVRVTRRFGSNEVAGLFHHVSRHLSDRAKRQAIDWNTIGAELLRTETLGQLRTDSLLRGAWVIKHSYADYTWQFGGRVRLNRPISPRTALIGDGSVDVFGIDADIAGRQTQVGAYAEGGVSVAGTAGALDLIVAFERRVDADPLIRGPRSWVLVGFRLVGP